MLLEVRLMRLNKYFTYSLIAFSAVLVSLLWMGDKLIVTHQDYHQSVAEKSTRSAAHQVTQFILERERLVDLFAKQFMGQIHKIILDSENEVLRDEFTTSIAEFFPDYFAFTIANAEGIPYFEDFDGFISELCISDLKQFGQVEQNRQIIHPNSEGYHFDVMSKFKIDDFEVILFISFYAGLLGDILETTQTSGHQMMLIYPERAGLIEVIAAGARNVIVRDDYRLDKQEQARILKRVPVEHTRWQALDFKTPNLFSDYRRQVYSEGLLIMIVISIVLGGLYFRLQKEAALRIAAENQKETFMRVVAHELRTPAASVSGALGAINDGLVGEIPNEAKKLIQVCSRNTEQLMSLVDDFLDFNRMESGKFKLSKNITCVNDLIEETLYNCQSYVDKFGCKIEFLPCEKNVASIIDFKRIQQVLTNLLSNAAKYGAKNAIIKVDLNSANGLITIGVANSGEGVPKSIQKSLFQPYVMSAKSNDLGISSTGLGLSIAKSIVESHGGKIDFSSDVEQETRFYFTLVETELDLKSA